jgi:hypothetical protein
MCRAGRRRAVRLRHAEAGHAQPGRWSGITMKQIAARHTHVHLVTQYRRQLIHL